MATISPSWERQRRRRGAAIVYIAVMMVVFMGFVSLSVDLGNVQVTKTQLQIAAEAAARAGAFNLLSGTSAAKAAAVAVAANNTANGSAVSLNSTTDVIVGTWSNGTFTSGGSSPNAVEVYARRTAATSNAVPLFFASVIGQSTCNITVSAIAEETPALAPSFVGLSSVTMGNNATVQSYNSANGGESSSNQSDNGVIGSNGPISFANDTTIDGNINLGPSGSVSHGNAPYTVTGAQTTESSAISYAAAASPTVASSGSVTYGSNATLKLAGGTYNYANITAGSSFTLQFTGPATLYVTGTLSFTGATTIIAYDNIPSNLRIILVGSASVTQTGNGMVCTGVVYGPSASFTAGGGLIFDGSLIVNTINTGVGTYFNYDTALNYASGSTVATVQ